MTRRLYVALATVAAAPIALALLAALLLRLPVNRAWFQ